MRESDRQISYRPEVAEHLKKGIKSILAMYKKDQRVVLYNVISQYLEKNGDMENSRLFTQAADFMSSDNPFADEEFYVRFEEKISKVALDGIENLANITEPTAFRVLIPMYKQLSADLRTGMDRKYKEKQQLTVMEKRLVHLRVSHYNQKGKAIVYVS